MALRPIVDVRQRYYVQLPIVSLDLRLETQLSSSNPLIRDEICENAWRWQ